jgi:hypothetical protein
MVMTLLDRFRTQARDKHPDPVVRLAFVDELPLSERAAIAAMAREDEDPRVRKAAVAKLMAPDVLATIARDDRDEQVRTQATAMLRDLALEAFEDTGEAEGLLAVEGMADPRTLAQVAKAATRESVAARALARLEDAHMIGSVARHGVVDAIRLSALGALSARSERAEILGVALNSDFKDTAVAATDLLGDRDALDQIVARSKNKSAVKRARTLVREAEEQAAREAEAAAAAATMAAIAAEPAVVEPLDALVSPPHGDPLAVALDTIEDPAAAEARRQQDEADAAERAATAAQAEADARAAADAELAQRQARLTALAEEAATAAADTDFNAARKRFGAIRREWRTLAADIAVPEAPAEAFATLDAQMNAREQEAQDADARARREALTRVQHLLGRVEPLVGKADLSLKAAERALRDVRSALAAMPPLPSKQDFEEVSGRLKTAQAALTPKVVELRETEDWRRFANVSIQEGLCARMEALKTADDLEAAATEVRELQQQWRAAADVPRAQADALWRRFKAAHDEVWTRCEAHFAVQNEQRAENLAKKIALCERVEALVDSTQWIQTAEEIKTLQAEWKTIGPVSRGKEKAIWDRFRAACDRFFTRRHEDLAERKASWAENLAKKDALSARAEALAESSDWDEAAAEIKKLQAEWKTVGPVKKSRSEAVWQRFRGACDRFFARYAQRHDTVRAGRIAAREAICVELEALAAGDAAPDDLASTVRTLRGRWQTEVGGRGVDPETARQLDDRFGAALTAVLTRWPAAFAGSDLDPDANRKRMETLVRRIEDVAASLAGPAPSDTAASPTTRLAAMLKEALAANTIGGKAEDDSRFRTAMEDVRQAQAAWSRVGLVPDEARRPLADRFQRAVRSISDRAAKASGAVDAGRQGGGQGGPRTLPPAGPGRSATGKPGTSR